MNPSLPLGALLGSLLLGACAVTPTPPALLVEARATVQRAQTDPGVLAQAPLELKKATDSLGRADMLLAKGEPLADVNSAAYVAGQQARTAMAIAQAKGNEAAIAGAEVDRERTRADVRTAEAQRAKAQAVTAQAQTGLARQQTAAAEQRATGAEQQTAVAQADAAAAQNQSAQLQQRLTELQAKQTERGMLVTLGDVLFEFNRAEVKPGAQTSLRKLADFLQQYPSRRILIEGFTDNIGSAASNEALSRRRADSVNVALLGMGVASQRSTTVGYGEQYPIADNNTETNRALNRRVEVYIAENDQPVKSRR
jgi:outer membrane protein OmpA-like peptidoglycan-associated protein